MTNEEVRDRLDIIITKHEIDDENVTITNEKDYDAMRVAIKALEQQTCEDAVSREDVLMALTGEWTELTDELIHRFIRRIKKLPSVNPAEKQEPCEDAVSREAVLGLFAQNADAVRPYSKTWEEVKDLPSVNPQPICEEREKGECPYYAG